MGNLKGIKMSDIISFDSLPVIAGKGSTIEQKVQQHLKNGANVGALMAINVGKKALIADISSEGMADTVHKLASGDIRPAVALITAKGGQALSIMSVDGKAPYSEWLRIGATLRGMPQASKTGKLTSAAKALALFNQLSEGAKVVREIREQQKALDAEPQRAAQIEQSKAEFNARFSTL